MGSYSLFQYDVHVAVVICVYSNKYTAVEREVGNWKDYKDWTEATADLTHGKPSEEIPCRPPWRPHII